MAAVEVAASTASPEFPVDLAHAARIYLRPAPIIPPVHADPTVASGSALPLAGGPYVFTGCEVLIRDADRVRAGVASLVRIEEWKEALGEAYVRSIEEQVANLSGVRPAIAGLHRNRPLLMGVINVTPDSFYSGSQVGSLSAAVDSAREMIEAGADIIDVGGESSRPGGALPIGVDEELSRVLPVIQALADLPVPVSVDTRHARVMTEGVAAGAAMINDINALAGEGGLEAAASTDVPVILMHCPANFAAMHKPVSYDHVALDVFDWLRERVETCVSAGISRERLIVDPGIGFVKQAPQSAATLARVSLLHGLGCPILVGASRKSFIGRLAGGESADDRLPGSLAAALWAQREGVQILRVHDVAETRQAVALQSAIEAGLADASQPFHCTMTRLAD